MALSRTASAVLAALLLAPAVAVAQPAPPPMPPQTQAMQQTILELTGQKLDWQTQAIALQRLVDDLQKQLAAAKPTPPAPPETPKP